MYHEESRFQPAAPREEEPDMIGYKAVVRVRETEIVVANTAVVKRAVNCVYRGFI